MENDEIKEVLNAYSTDWKPEGRDIKWTETFIKTADKEVITWVTSNFCADIHRNAKVVVFTEVNHMGRIAVFLEDTKRAMLVLQELGYNINFDIIPGNDNFEVRRIPGIGTIKRDQDFPTADYD